MLNSQQKAAVTSWLNEDAQIIAGAGSGKTTVLTQRIAYLVQNGVQPWKILAVTFTNKAAQEMRNRLFDLLGEDAARRIQMGTFHALGRRILLRHREEMGLPPTLSILDRKEQEGLLLRVVQRLYGENDSRLLEKRLGEARKTPENRKRLQRQRQTERDLAGFALRKIGGWKQAGKYPPPDPIPGNVKADVRQALAIYGQYEKEKARLGLFDFDDLITRVNTLFQDRPDLLQKERGRIQHLLVDEFQDVNAEQVRWISLLAGSSADGAQARLFLVGDEDQSIYGWRGSRPDLMRAFGRERKMGVYLLEHNYRSSPVILEAANAVIRNNPDREEKVLRTQREDRLPIGVFQGDTEKEEARWVANQVESLVRKRRGSPSGIAVLYRAKSVAQKTLQELVSRGIPARMVGDTSFQETAEVRDAMAWLRCIDNPDNDGALLRALQHPPSGIGPKVIQAMEEESDLRGVSCWEALCQMPSTPATTAFLAKVNRLRAEKDEIPFPDFVQAVLQRPLLVGDKQKPSLWDWTESQENGEARIANLETLLQAAVNQEARWAESCLAGQDPSSDDGLEENDPLREFLSQVALAGTDSDDPDVPHQVSFLTIHKAKGLEYPVVFVLGCNEGIFPSRKDQDPDGDCENLEEERRLFYVATTRAKQALFLTGARQRQTFSGYDGDYPLTRFLEEIPEALLEKDRPERLVDAIPESALGASPDARPMGQDPKQTREAPGKRLPSDGAGFAASVDGLMESADVLDTTVPDMKSMPGYLDEIPFLENAPEWISEDNEESLFLAN
ncbi:ATP-dependent helicase [Acidithiobacillus sp. IBUN Pt1247-S3]|uniref:ATP-dependent helicase n=1 Tax=Acidithiobacillus sp. IBUN Pt1247-S3 TaxID=3166642 RepID=UPI0034E3C28A